MRGRPCRVRSPPYPWPLPRGLINSATPSVLWQSQPEVPRHMGCASQHPTVGSGENVLLRPLEKFTQFLVT